MTKVSRSPVKPNPTRRRMQSGLVIGVLLLLVSGTLAIPFVYESTTLWYKVGIDKTMLRAGQLFGLLAALLLLLQIIFAVRGKFLEDLFGVAALMRLHRANGIVISLLAICHVALVIVPEGIANLPIGKKYWPEMVGILLFWIILSMAISSHFRQQLGLVYKRWRAVHKVLGYCALFLVAIHVLFVSDSFQHSVPKIALLGVITAVIILVLLTKQTGWRKQNQKEK